MIHERTLQSLEFPKVLEYLAYGCLSEAGKDAALALRPLSTLPEVLEAARLFDQARTWASAARLHGENSFAMVAFPDVRPLLEQTQKTTPRLDLEDFWALREMLRLATRAVASLRQNTAQQQWPDLLMLAESFALPQQITSALNRCIADDGSLKDESSPELYLARTELRRLHQSCMRKVKEYAIQYNMLAYLQDEFMTLASDRYVLPLKANFKGRMQGIIHDWSQTGETCYFEPMFLVEINNTLQELKRQEREEELKVVQYLTSLLLAEAPGVRAGFALLCTLDVLFAKIRLADRYDGHCVTVLGGIMDEELAAKPDMLELKGARHPLLLLAALKAKKAPESVHPLDILLRKGERGLIISGGNAGGKTVCLKTLGLVAAMTFAGLPVPVAKGSFLPFWQRIDAFIGDEQSLDDHVSTFTAQIQHLAKSWKYMDKNTLVLLDEFGAGTDPAQGAALAQGLLDELLDKDTYVLASTHFPALKAYALTREKARAASVLFDPNTKKPLFRLAYDQVGASQALDVAREHGLPESILRRAEHYLLLDGEDASAVMARLNSLAVQREQELADLQHELAKQKKQKEHLHNKFEQERQKLHEQVRARSAELMQAWKEGKATHKQALKEMSRLRAELLPAKDEPTRPALQASDLELGQQVLHRPFGKKALIMEIDGRKNKARIDMNGVCLWANIADLEESGAAAPVRTASTARLSPDKGSLLTLDLRGKRADIALSDLEQFLDKALLAGMDSVEIVHGRGTGVLRKEIHAFLRRFPSVREFATAPEDRGGDGMTIAVFR